MHSPVKTSVSAHHRTPWQVHLHASDICKAQQIGVLWQNMRTDLPAAFAYAPQWLTQKGAFMIDPRLMLYSGDQYPAPNKAAFGVFMDSAPDRWGRVLMDRREGLRAQQENRNPRNLQEIDYLLGVHDATRMGALRFRAADELPFVDNSPLAAPPITRLAELAYASTRIEQDDVQPLSETEQWLAMLMAPGSSLGGARPKANFVDAHSLWIAKFPSIEDRYDVGGWELLAHQLAQRAGVTLPAAKGLKLSERYLTFCSQRFDRSMADSTPLNPADIPRKMYASAMTLLEQTDGGVQASYLDIAEFITLAGAQGHIQSDLAQLFRRVLFNIRIGNRDDHLRNHGFLLSPTGWRLAPAFDVNPNLYKAHHTLNINATSSTPDIPLALNTAEYYRLSNAQAKTVLNEVDTALQDWQTQAEQLGLNSNEVKRMRSVIQA